MVDCYSKVFKFKSLDTQVKYIPCSADYNNDMYIYNVSHNSVLYRLIQTK
jgi:hypothetical protein